MTSVIVEHSCSLSGAICNLLRIVIIIIILSQKLANNAINHAWIHDKAEKLIWTMFFFDCQLKLSITHQTSIRSICKLKHIKLPPSRMSGSAMASLPDLPGYDQTWGCWMHQHEDLLGTLILHQSKVDASFFCIAPLFVNLTSYAWQWPEWKFEDSNYSMSHLQTDQSCSDAI